MSSDRVLNRFSGSILLIILAFAFITRMLYVHTPSTYYFDEVYHAVTAKLIARGDERAFEWWHTAPEPDTAIDWLHPPVAKYLQAGSILLFGENSFSYRLSSVIFGVLSILLIYHLALVLFGSTRLALLSSLLASLDGLLLAQSRITMNDIHVTTFMLFTIYSYLRFRKADGMRWLWLSGVGLGLAMSTKWTGLLLLPAFVGISILDWVAARYTFRWKRVGVWLLAMIVLPAAIYLASYGQAYMQGKDLNHIVALHKQIWWYQTNLTATHPAQSRPWQWILNIKPVWYHVEYISQSQRANIYAQGNTPLYWLGLVAVGVAGFTVMRSISKGVRARGSRTSLAANIPSVAKSLSTNPLFIALVFYLVVWVPWFFSPRIMFFYHYAPAVPWLSILLGWMLLRLDRSKPRTVWLLWIAIAIIGGWFVLWYPYWTGTPVPVWLTEQVYQRFPIWK